MRNLLETFLIIVLTSVVIIAGSYLLASPKEASPLPTEEAVAVPMQNPEATIEPSVIPIAETEAVILEETTPVSAASYDFVPQYFQTDYPYIAFGNGTISTSGCSITCLAMVASYLTEQEYLPDQMAYHFGSFGKTNIERLEYGNSQMQLPNTRTDDVTDVLKALKEGKVVIAMMGPDSIFTNEQHFIVLTGMTEDGLILVNDPMKPNYTADVYLKNGFLNGFGNHDIMVGFSGAWIYDKESMPDAPFLFDASIPEQEKHRYTGYEMSEEDIYTLACFLWLEARNESEQVQQAIVEVILNRVMSPDFPNTVHNILYRGEFYGKMVDMKYAKPDYPQYRAVTAAMYGPYQLPSNVYYFSVWETQGEQWGKIGSYTFLHSR